MKKTRTLSLKTTHVITSHGSFGGRNLKIIENCHHLEVYFLPCDSRIHSRSAIMGEPVKEALLPQGKHKNIRVKIKLHFKGVG